MPCGELGGVGRGVAVVQLVASAQGRPFGPAGRGAGALAGGLAAAGAVRGDGNRTGSIATVGGPRRALWGSVLAGPNGQAITPGIHAPRTRSAAEGSASLDQRDLRLRTPLASEGRATQFVEVILRGRLDAGMADHPPSDAKASQETETVDFAQIDIGRNVYLPRMAKATHQFHGGDRRGYES